MQLYLIPPNLLPDFMEQVFPMIDAATTYSVGKYTGADVVKLLISGAMQLWAAIEDTVICGIGITEIANYPQARVCRVLCVTGNAGAKMLVGFIEGIEKWAKEQRCKSVQAECRAGWEKHMKPFGYTKNHVIMNKELA